MIEEYHPIAETEERVNALYRAWCDLPWNATCDERQDAARAFVLSADIRPKAREEVRPKIAWTFADEEGRETKVVVVYSYSPGRPAPSSPGGYSHDDPRFSDEGDPEEFEVASVCDAATGADLGEAARAILEEDDALLDAVRNHEAARHEANAEDRAEARRNDD